jgi:hypothetical protein
VAPPPHRTHVPTTPPSPTASSLRPACCQATLLVFENSRDYDIVLPLLAAAGTGPLVVQQFKRATQAAPAAAGASVSEPRSAAVQVVPPPACEVDAPPAGGCDEAARLVLPDECDVDNRVTVCLDEPAREAGQDGDT